MANYAFGLLLVIVILILALWVGDGRVWAFTIASLIALASVAYVSAGTGAGKIGGKLDRMDDTVPADRAHARLGVKITVKDVLRNAKSAIKSATAAAAIAASAGMAGDTVIEIVSIVVDATLWLGQLAAVFLNNSASYGATLSKIWALDFKRGAAGIHEDMAAIVAEAGGPSSAVFAEVRRVYSDTMDWLLSLLGTAISACVPDDAGTVGWAFSEITIMGLRTASANVWWIVSSLYNALPEIARNMLQNPADLANIAIYAIESVEKYILADGNDSWWKTLSKSLGRNAAITTATFGVLLLNPILMFPVAGTIFLSGQLANALYTVGIGNKQISAVLHALYERPVSVPGVGMMTAVEAMVMFMQKITVLTFAGLYVLSDNTVAAADAPPAGFVPPGLGDLRDRAKAISVKAPPTRVANVPDVTDAQMEAVAAK